MNPNDPQTFTPQQSGGDQHFDGAHLDGTTPPFGAGPFQPPAHQQHEHHHGHQAHHSDAQFMPPQHTFQPPLPPVPPSVPDVSAVTPSFPPTPTPQAGPSPFDPAVQSQPVVKVLSPFGIEYVFLALTLFFGAAGLVTSLLILINGGASFSALAFPAAMLLVTVPIFAFLFLRLKKLELRMPHLRLDASKRRTTQLIQIVSFIASIVSIITFVYSVFATMAGQSGGMSVWKSFLDMLCVVVVAGGILAYYWREEHRSR